MGSVARITFGDGTAVYLEVDQPAPGLSEPAGPALPGGLGATTPVGVDVPKLIDKTGAALTAGLKSMMPVLESVHDAVLSSPRRPDEVSVQLGFKFDSTLDLVFVKGHGEASFVVTAKWNLAHEKPDSKDPDGAVTGP